jgi:hypothetical protein
MVAKSRALRAQELEDVLTNILDQELNDPIPLACTKTKINSVEMLIDSSIASIDTLTYDAPDGFEADGTTLKTKVEDVPDGYKTLIKIFKTYIGYECEVNALKLRDDWTKLDRERFNDYRFTQECSYRVMQLSNPLAPNPGRRNTSSTQQVVTSQAMKSMSADPHDIIKREWKKGIRRDPSAYSTFTNNKQWENWNRGFVVTANAQMLPNVLNPTYSPLIGSVDETTFKLEQTYMYNVLNKTVLTNKGKEILRAHHVDRNAQKAYADLCEHYSTSTAAVIDAIDTYKYIITAKIEDWRGDTKKFIMHWFEQVRLYESVAEPEAYMTEQQKIMNLNIAVQSNRELATVDTTFKSMLSMDKTKVPTIAQFKDLLLSAAVNYDRTQGAKGGRNGSKAPSRQVYSHETEPTYDFDIDTPLFEVMHAETTRNGNLEAYQSETTDRKPPRPAPTPLQRKPTLRWDQWKELPNAARQLWDKLDDDDKRIILRYHDPG